MFRVFSESKATVRHIPTTEMAAFVWDNANVLRRCLRYGCAEVHIKPIFSEMCVPRGGIAEDLSSEDVTLFLWAICDVKYRGTSVFEVKQSS
jgi:hypothetical protein